VVSAALALAEDLLDDPVAALAVPEESDVDWSVVPDCQASLAEWMALRDLVEVDSAYPADSDLVCPV
jgi:hypothetical protein